ncbi:multicopper oxidase family protein [Agromyces bracchium]|uniref:Multicopper oxidase domain-containing protein n=1 Tax=Agromyces bracchium TaxID=88376 RepID=A0A6I3MCZ5_9MICO|nr:multicopper oxidase domain-containing protein [Agromyces bracchium]
MTGPDSSGSGPSRRAVLIGGAAAVGAIAVGAGGLAWWTGSRVVEPDSAAPGSTDAPPSGDGSAKEETFREPEVRASSGGRLDLELSAAVTTATVGDRQVRVLGFEGGMPGPTLRVRAGDRISLRYRNDLGATTNLHTHGLEVSPERNSDNVFVMIPAGGTFDYAYELGDDHPTGVFWYHPHHHGTTAEQLFAGLYGAIVVEEPEPLPVARERVLVIADIAFDANGDVAAATRVERMLGREGDLVLVNGQLLPTMVAAPGARERWRIVNACTSRYLRLRLDGQRMHLLGIDAGRFPEPREVDEIVLLPGNRADVLVEATAGEAVLQTLPFDRGSMGMMGAPRSATTGADLARFVVSGDAAASVAPLPAASAAPRDLRDEEVTGRRTLTLAMGAMGGGMGQGMGFTIDGRTFAEGRTDIEQPAGTIEEWTIENTSTMDHPFHLHVWPMQLVEVDGKPVTGVDRRDVVPVPAGGRVVVRIAFEGITGRTVYHCHILDHEDLGMMGAIRVA